jgi:hypothetical protein
MPGKASCPRGKMRQSGAYLANSTRVSIKEHGTAVGDGPAFSSGSWSSSTIADMRRFKTGSVDIAFAPERIDRSARSLTDSDSASLASAATW